MNTLALSKVQVVEHLDFVFDCLVYKSLYKLDASIDDRKVGLTVTLINGELDHIQFSDNAEAFFSWFPMARLTCQAQILDFLITYKSKGKS